MHILSVFPILPQERGAHKEVNHMDNHKKPSGPVEEERWALKRFIDENWHTIALAAATTIAIRLLLGW